MRGIRERTGIGIAVAITGILLLEVLGNLFPESFGTLTYLFIPIPLIGVLYLFVDRKRFGRFHGRASGLALFLMVSFFIALLLLGFLYYLFLYRRGDFDAARMAGYGSLALYLIPMLAALTGVMGLAGERDGKILWGVMAVCVILTIAGLFLVKGPLETHMKECGEIDRDDILEKEGKKNLYEVSAREFDEDSAVSRLPFALAGLLTAAAMGWVGREQLKNLVTVMTGRMGRTLTKKKEW